MTYNLSDLHVLCIDDNKHMQQIYWISLNSVGFSHVKFAADGGDALEMMATNKFDLILCDLNMSPIDGLEFIKLVRKAKDSTHPDIPIIIVSGNTEIKNIEAARDAGATEFMAKPISIDNLLGRIRNVIEKPRGFTEGGGFKGPDRRRRRSMVFDGSDRRDEKLVLQDK